MKKILFIIDFPISNFLPSGALRYFELAKVLKDKYKVAIVGVYKDKTAIEIDGVELLDISAFIEYNLGLKISLPNKKFLDAINKFDLIVTHGRILSSFAEKDITPKVIIDLYAPWFIEDLVGGKDGMHKVNMEQIKKIVSYGTHFLCASERQRDLYIGIFLSFGITDKNLDQKFSILPIGIPSNNPMRGKSLLRGDSLKFSNQDKIVMWWSGIWEWLDPITPIKGMKKIAKYRDDIKLLFIPVKGGEAGKGVSQIAKESIGLSKSMGMFDKKIFFIDQWVPYEERGNILLDADIGIISHHANIETRFSWRTRGLDFLWSETPIVTTGGDPLSEIIKDNDLGLVIPSDDPEAFADAVLELFNNRDQYDKIKANIYEFKPSLYWENLAVALEWVIEELV